MLDVTDWQRWLVVTVWLLVRLQVPGWETASAGVVPIDGFVLSNLPSNVAYMTVTVFQMGTAGDVGAVNYDAVAAQLLESYIVVVIDMFDSSGLYVSDPLELDLCFSSLDPTLQFGAYQLDSGDPPALHAWEEVRCWKMMRGCITRFAQDLTLNRPCDVLCVGDNVHRNWFELFLVDNRRVSVAARSEGCFARGARHSAKPSR